MTEPSLALQRAIRTRLIDTPGVLADVSSDMIIDGPARPDQFPAIIIGDGQTVLEGYSYSLCTTRVYSDIHVWVEATGFEAVKSIAGKVWESIGRALDVPGFLMADGVHVTGARYLRDPSGQHSHAVLTVEALMGQQL